MRLMGAFLAIAMFALPGCEPQSEPVREINIAELPRTDWPPRSRLGEDDGTTTGSRAAALLESLKDEPGFIASEANLKRVDALVRAALEFVLFHETAHMLLIDHRIPNPGGRSGGEIAADRFAAFVMTPPPRAAGAPKEMLDPAAGEAPAVLWATAMWRQEQRRLEASGQPHDWADEHGLPEQRLHQVMCLIYGSDPDRWIQQQAFADAVSNARRDLCIAEAAENADFWRRHVLAHFDDAADPASRYNPAVHYEPATDDLAGLQNWFASTGMLEEFAGVIGSIRLPEGASQLEMPVTIVASACETDQGNVINAFWNPNARTMIVCYPLIGYFESLAVDMLGALPRSTQENPVPDR